MVYLTFRWPRHVQIVDISAQPPAPAHIYSLYIRNNLPNRREETRARGDAAVLHLLFRPSALFIIQSRSHCQYLMVLERVSHTCSRVQRDCNTEALFWSHRPSTDGSQLMFSKCYVLTNVLKLFGILVERSEHLVHITNNNNNRGWMKLIVHVSHWIETESITKTLTMYNF